MWYNNKSIQYGYGNVVLSDSEESESESSQESELSSQHSQSSDGIDSFREEMEQTDPWDCIQNDSFERYKSRFHDLVNDYEQNGDSSEVAGIKADNALLTELRKVFLRASQDGRQRLFRVGCLNSPLFN